MDNRPAGKTAITYALLVLAVSFFACSSLKERRLEDIQKGMSKQEVLELWGAWDLKVPQLQQV